jgi:TRAP-type C4-dicarboxylate transport system permease small subunit
MKSSRHIIGRIVAFVIDYAIIISSLSILMLILFQILARYVFGWSVVGVLELVMIFGVWLYMLGSLAASRKDEHLVVDLMSLSLPSDIAKHIHKTLIAFITAIICLFFIVWAYKMMMWGMKRPQSTPGLSIPLLLPQSALMFAAVGSFLYALRDIITNINIIRQCRKAN